MPERKYSPHWHVCCTNRVRPLMNRWLVAVTVMLPTLIEIIDMSVVNVAQTISAEACLQVLMRPRGPSTMYCVSECYPLSRSPGG